jgi:hypothetical protein
MMLCFKLLIAIAKVMSSTLPPIAGVWVGVFSGSSLRVSLAFVIRFVQSPKPFTIVSSFFGSLSGVGFLPMFGAMVREGQDEDQRRVSSS